MSISADNHHEQCDGSECATWDCAGLPENIGQFREGMVIETNPVGEPEGSVEIEWSDGTRSILRPPKRERGLPGRLAPCGNPQCPCSLQPREGYQQ